MDSIVTTPVEALRALAEKWYERNSIIAVGHYKAAARYAGLHVKLSSGAAMLSAAVGTAVFVALQQQPAKWLQIGTGLLSILAAILATLAAKLGYQDKAEKHRIAGSKYNSVGRELEQILAQSEIDRGSIKEVRIRLDALAQEMPHIPRSVHSKMPKFRDVDNWDGR